jgi:hypothetical protein
MGVIYTYPRKRRFQNAVLGCVLLRKNFQNGIPTCSTTKYPGLKVCGKICSQMYM